MGFYKASTPQKFSPKKREQSELGSIKASKDSPKLYEDFLEDWGKIRVRHAAQQEILNAFFVENKKYLFLRIGRKGAKTTTNIEIAWRYSMMVPMATTFICLPTITQAIEVYWDEKRLQWCDIKDGWMADKYIAHIDNNKHMLTFVNGSTVKLIGTWSEARGRGTQPNLLIVDEIQDSNAEYLDAMEPNLAAKEDSRCVMSGTPPRKKNHYHTWETRIKSNTEGFHAEYTSYVNTALPHLAPWLDKKHEELKLAGKESDFLREYLVQDCFSSDDRVLPDIKTMDFEEMLFKLRSIDPSAYQPLFGLIVASHSMTATYSVMLHSKYTGTEIFNLESVHINRLWDRSYYSIYKEMSSKMADYSGIFSKPWRQAVYDETKSFADVIPQVTLARTDLKWTERGVPLMKEMILNNKLSFTNKSGEIGVECQNLLKEDDIRLYPTVCNMAMLANEFYQMPCLSKNEQERWDRYEPLRQAGILCSVPTQKGLRTYGVKR